MSRSSRYFQVSASCALLVAACAVLGACRQSPPHGNAADAEPGNGTDTAFELPDVPRPDPRLDRAALLSAVAIAASAAASGSDAQAAQRSLDGAIFTLRIRFGCAGPASTLRTEALGWDFDEAQRRLRVRAMPTITAGDELVGKLTDARFEAVEGFWIPRPWMLDAACPVAPPPLALSGDGAAAAGEDNVPPEVVTKPVAFGPRIGIAQFFTSSDSRTRRRASRAYEATKILPAGEPVSSVGWNLVLSGRLKSLEGKGVIACSATSTDRPPDCVISVDFDKVWIEFPDTGEILAEWGGG